MCVYVNAACFFRTHKFIVKHIFDWSMQAQNLLNEEKTHSFFLCNLNFRFSSISKEDGESKKEGHGRRQ